MRLNEDAPSLHVATGPSKTQTYGPICTADIAEEKDTTFPTVGRDYAYNNEIEKLINGLSRNRTL
jgi:hypothetical protein